VFDSFGTYSKLIPITGANRIQVRGNGVFLEFENRLIKYNPVNFEQMEIELPRKDFLALSIEKDRLYILKKDSVLMFKAGKTKAGN
jgi:hypothetical protein